MQDKLKTIRQIARKVRRRCEKYAKRRDNYFNKDLMCMCAIASFCIHKLLQFKGIDSEFVFGKYHGEESRWGSDHCWLEWRGYVIDVTATQFEHVPKVIVRRDNENRWCVKRVLDDTYKWRGWDRAQVPCDKTVEAIIGNIR